MLREESRTLTQPLRSTANQNPALLGTVDPDNTEKKPTTLSFQVLLIFSVCALAAGSAIHLCWLVPHANLIESQNKRTKALQELVCNCIKFHCTG